MKKPAAKRPVVVKRVTKLPRFGNDKEAASFWDTHSIPPLRAKMGLQQVELARALGVSKVTVCRYERNRSRPQDVVIKRLKTAFEVGEECDKFL